jgi:DNA-directed RNA polymerase subunit RPC12/RpoP
MAATPIITCPECDKKFKGKEDLQGKKIRCPFCKQAFVVPVNEEEETVAPARAGAKAAAAGKKPAQKDKAPPSPPKPPAVQVPANKGEEGEEEAGSNPYGITHLDLAPRCPNCANEMESEEAVVCLFCGYNTLSRTWGKTDKVIEHTFRDYFFHLLPGLLCLLFILSGVAGVIYYCLVLPDIKKWGWLGFTDHESTRLWMATLVLFFSWPAGLYAFNRLVMHAKPPDKLKG